MSFVSKRRFRTKSEQGRSNIFQGFSPNSQNNVQNRQQDFEAHQLYSQVPQFYDFLQNRVLVSFKPKFEEISDLNPEFELILSKKNTYDVVRKDWLQSSLLEANPRYLCKILQMAQRVGDHLKHDPLRLRFTSSNANNMGPKAVIKRALNQSVGDLTQTGYFGHQHVNLSLYYERLDVSIIELETKKSLKITWTGSHNKEEVRAMMPMTDFDRL